MDNYINDNEALKAAIQFLHSSKFSEAETILLNLSLRLPDNAIVSYLLGVVYLQLGNLQESKVYLEKAAYLNPNDEQTLNALGVLYQNINEHQNAIVAFSKVLQLNRNSFNALNNLAISLEAENRLEEAIQTYYNLILLEGEKPSTLYNIALIYQNSKKLSEAIEFYNKVLKIDSLHYLSYNNLGLIFKQQAKKEDAYLMFKKAYEINPSLAEAAYNLASIAKEKEDYNTALNYYNRILQSHPLNFDALMGKGDLHYRNRQFSESLNCYFSLIKDYPGNAELYYNIALVQMELGEYSSAKSNLDSCLAIEPTHTPAHFALGDVYLITEDFANAWKEYELRLDFTIYEKRKYSKPKWCGQDLAGKTLFIFEEQGAGDTFQFIRYFPEFTSRGAKIILECRPENERLCTAQPYIDTLIVMGKSAVSEEMFDYYLPLMSIPVIFNIDLSTTNSNCPYIHINNSVVSVTTELILELREKGKYKIGIVWEGNPYPEVNRKRHTDLRLFEQISNLKSVKLFSFQIGKGSKSISDVGFGNKIIDCSPFIKDYADTAYYLSQVDLIITVDTSIAHLSGALGLHTAVLLAKYPDWRWGRSGESSPWYPTVTLFRQENDGDWSEIFNDLYEYIKYELTIYGYSTDFEAEIIAKPDKSRKMTLALTGGANFGWGVCSDYLKKEISKIEPIDIFEGDKDSTTSVDGTVLHAITGVELEPLCKVRGTEKNIGYTFFEDVLTEKSVANASQYDLILAGSTWCKEKLEEKGIVNTGVLIQGIDPLVFYPPTKEEDLVNQDNFVIFSGGKFELRKGQDLVLRAVRAIQEKYENVILVNSWFNLWPQTMELMALSKHINFELKGVTHEERMAHLYRINGLDENRIITLPLIPNEKQREIYLKTDIGLFPNRCEGGTNLVLMEYMACGKPVIASFNTGHKDILNDMNSIPLKNMRSYQLTKPDGTLNSAWEEPFVEEVIAALDWAYNNRALLHSIGAKAGEEMKKFTWSATAKKALEYMK